MNFDKKRFLNDLENQTRLQNSANTTRKSLIFRVLCALFEQIPSGINQDILKNPTGCGAKNSNKLCAPSHLVTWIPHTDKGAPPSSFQPGKLKKQQQIYGTNVIFVDSIDV